MKRRRHSRPGRLDSTRLRGREMLLVGAERRDAQRADGQQDHQA